MHSNELKMTDVEINLTNIDDDIKNSSQLPVFNHKKGAYRSYVYIDTIVSITAIVMYYIYIYSSDYDPDTSFGYIVIWGGYNLMINIARIGALCIVWESSGHGHQGIIIFISLLMSGFFVLMFTILLIQNIHDTELKHNRILLITSYSIYAYNASVTTIMVVLILCYRRCCLN